MVPPHHYSSKQLDHLGLVAGMCEELGIVELIDRLILQDEEKRTVSIGQAVFPNQKGELITNPTARWVFQFFSGIQVLVIGVTQELMLNLNEHQAALLKLLGARCELLYSGSG